MPTYIVQEKEPKEGSIIYRPERRKRAKKMVSLTSFMKASGHSKRRSFPNPHDRGYIGTEEEAIATLPQSTR